MKKLFYAPLFSLIFSAHAGALSAPSATPWWLQPTICKPNTTNCYSNMGAGYDSGMWDATSNCWGLKKICAEATTSTSDEDYVEMGRVTIANGTGINSDFDTTVLNGDCFGARKTTASGTLASVSGSYVNVWCNGILDNPGDTVSNGEIQIGTQPTCKDLAANGWVAVLNQRCYGKYYDPEKYYIECEGTNLLPKRIIVLNGSQKFTGTGSAPSANYPVDANAADTLFDKMFNVSNNKKSDHFK
ncbi:MAG TPA: hypothetical protein PKJ33_02685 [Alphaproteobacteria bacterium]|nr:hypothetical protein [Alphaproteobacteria bacterium]